MMQAGQFDHWIRFEAETVTRDAIGGVDRTWALVVETWASTKVLNANQADKGGRVTHETARQFVVRRQDVAITPAMRIIWNGLTWRIVGMDDGLRSGEIKITASADQ